jgi:hypothetical protein
MSPSRLRIRAAHRLIRATLAVLRHIDISAWYSTGNDEYGGLSPRDYLRGKDWDEQTRIGLDILRKRGILK